MVSRTSTSMWSLFFVCSLGVAASSCDSQECWSKVVEDEEEGQGLELLQVKGAKAHRKICPEPSRSSYSPIAINCPTEGDDDEEPGSSCLEGNRAFHTFYSAWEKCGSMEECGAVMESRAGLFYLRRASDPESPWIQPGVKLFKYNCEANPGKLKNIEKNAIAKAQQLVQKGRAHEEAKHTAEARAFKMKRGHELQKQKPAAYDDVEEDGEDHFIADSNAKAAAMRKTAQLAAAKSQAMAKASRQGHSRQHTAGHFEQEAESYETHTHSTYKRADMSKQRVKNTDEELDKLNLELDRLTQEAEAKAQEAKKVEARIKHIKATAAMTTRVESGAARAASQHKARYHKSAEDVQQQGNAVHEDLHEKRRVWKDYKEESRARHEKRHAIVEEERRHKDAMARAEQQAELARAEHQAELARTRAAAASKSKYHHQNRKEVQREEGRGAEKFHMKSPAELAIEKAMHKAGHWAMR